ncbi:MAG: ABC transporter permease [Oscillospiraceae bacterium]
MLTVLQTALEVGLIYGLVALALFISFSILNIADLSTDGCFTLGCAVGAMLTIAGHPILALSRGHGGGYALGLRHGLFADAPRRREHPRRHHLEHRPLHDQPRGHGLFVQRVHHRASIRCSRSSRALIGGASGAGWCCSRCSLGVIAIVLIRFFGTSLGLSIRATGDSLDMVSASSINPKVTITIGLCLANALTALSGCLIGEYNKFCDINLGTGMVTIALASLIIGEVFAGHRGGVGKRIVCVVLGSIVYRLIIALALRLNISAEYFKLVSAVIVAVAIAAPNMKGYVRLAKIKSNARKLRALSGKGDETDA